MKKYRVVVHDKYQWDAGDIYNSLYFDFEDIKEAHDFSKAIMTLSDYDIEIIKIGEDKEVQDER